MENEISIERPDLRGHLCAVPTRVFLFFSSLSEIEEDGLPVYATIGSAPLRLFIDLSENLHVYNTNDIHFFKDGPSEVNGVFGRW